MILRALFLAFGDLLRPRILGAVALGVGLTLLLFAALQAGAFWTIRNLAPETLSLPWLGAVPLAPALSWSSLILFPVMSIFLMVPVASAFTAAVCGIGSKSSAAAVPPPARRVPSFTNCTPRSEALIRLPNWLSCAQNSRLTDT